MTEPIAASSYVPQATVSEAVFRRPMISAYTPSNMDPKTRERIFVQRHQLLRQAVRWCEESMLTGNKHHALYIGPRGCGKTHLVSMVHDRVRANPQLADKMRIAWLGEDTVFTGLIDLAREIADELAKAYPDEFAFDYRTGARGLAPDDAAEQILGEIVRRLGDRSILLIMENLDRAMRGLGDTGQKKWRAFLQEQGRVATVATSQQLFEDVSSREAAFYGFFEIIHLEPLSVDDARDLMEKIARENDKADLVEFLRTPEGRYRVHALHHLAGGNHRMYVMVSEFLTKESLDGLVACFEELAEELTPYFQERIRSLSPQQARIVQSLCAADGAMTVKEIAEETFIPERNVSRQLGELRQRGYVRSEKRGKESYYDMAEPLMRLCLEVKKQRGEPLKLVAAFLRVWYSDSELQQELRNEMGMPGANARCLAYMKVALQADDVLRKIAGQEMASEFQRHIESERFDDAREIAEELVCADPPLGLLCRGLTHNKIGDARTAITDLSAVIELENAPVTIKSTALLARATCYSRLGNVEEEIADYTIVINAQDAPIEMKARALLARGLTYGAIRDLRRAMADLVAVVELENAPARHKATALVAQGHINSAIGNFEDVVADFSAVIRMPEASPATRTCALFCLPEATIPIKSLSESIASIRRAFEDGDPETREYGGDPSAVLNMVLRREHQSWPEFIQELISVYADYKALDKLGSGLTESIAALDDGDYSEAQLDLWNSSWQEFGSKHEELEIPLKALNAAIEAIKTGNDLSLFKHLPLEIRKIIRPLLKNTLLKE